MPYMDRCVLLCRSRSGFGDGERCFSGDLLAMPAELLIQPERNIKITSSQPMHTKAGI